MPSSSPSTSTRNIEAIEGYEKWRLILSVIVFSLAVQWLMLLPAVVLLVLYGLFHRQLMRILKTILSIFKTSAQQKQRRTVIINGCSQAVALHFARLLHHANHRVIACDYPTNWLNATRFSHAIDAYYTVPNPRRGVQEYIRALCLIAHNENADVFIPISRLEDWNFDLLTKTPLERQGCRVISLHSWIKTTAMIPPSNGISQNHFFSATNNNGNANRSDDDYDNDDDGRPDVEHASQESNTNGHRNGRKPLMRRMSSTESMKETFEQICDKVNDMSALMFCGIKYTSTCFIRENSIISMTTCPYNLYTSPTNWKEINAEVTQWASTIIKELPPENRSGALSFDLFITPEGRVIPYSCNPHIGMAALNFSAQDEMINCIIQPHASPPKKPYQVVGASQRYCIYPEIWKLLKQPTLAQLKRFFSCLQHSKEAFFDLSDPLPFFIHYHLHMPFLMLFEVVRGRSWTQTDFLNGKLLGC